MDQNCPYCGKPLTAGKIFAAGGYGIYWLPNAESIDGFLLSEKKILQAHGKTLGRVSSCGFFAKEPPAAHFCESCNTVVIQNGVSPMG